MSYTPNGNPRGRPKQFFKYELPSGVVKVVRAQCADYKRKNIALKNCSLSDEVRAVYEETNTVIRED